MFHKYDSDEDSHLTHEELYGGMIKEEAFDHDMMRRKGKNELVDQREMEMHDMASNIIGELDFNHDGFVSINEYLKDEL